jgi:organic radical activating enzyme
VFVKAVVSGDTTEAEIGRCAGMIADVDPSIPLVIQPVTSEQAVSPRLLMKLQEVALDRLDDVRVIPQCHKVMGLP